MINILYLNNFEKEASLHEAKVLLKQRTWIISEIAYALGYSEVNHFKKYLNITPTDFRKTDIV